MALLSLLLYHATVACRYIPTRESERSAAIFADDARCLVSKAAGEMKVVVANNDDGNIEILRTGLDACQLS